MEHGTWLVERPAQDAQRKAYRPATYDLRQLAQLMGITYAGASAQARAGTLPEPIQRAAIRWGAAGRQRWCFPRSVVNEVLGVSER